MAQRDDRASKKHSVVYLRDALELIYARCIYNTRELDTIQLQLTLKGIQEVSERALRGEQIFPPIQ